MTLMAEVRASIGPSAMRWTTAREKAMARLRQFEVTIKKDGETILRGTVKAAHEDEAISQIESLLKMHRDTGYTIAEFDVSGDDDNEPERSFK